MKVYRICSEVEINKIIETSSFLEVGSKGENAIRNNQRYEKEKLYLHFFYEKSSIFYFSTTKGKCICTYDIPENILKRCEGTGFYLDYVYSRNMVNVLEYAVNIEELKFEYLDKVQIIEKYLDFEDYLYDTELVNKTSVIYSKDTIKKLIK